MNKIEDLITKLDKITFNTRGTSSVSNDVWKVSYSTKLSTHFLGATDYSVQIVIHVMYKGQVVQTWGCIDNQDNAKFVNWFVKAKNQASDLEYKIEKSDRKHGESMFKDL